MPTDMTPSEVREFLLGDSTKLDPNNTWPRTSNPVRLKDAGAVAPPVVEQTDARSSAIERAKLRGWSVEPKLTNGSPHAFNACLCLHRKHRLSDESEGCLCPCHGRSTVHYRRGA